MSVNQQSDTNFTKQVKDLLNRIYGRSAVKDSLLDRAVEYYKEQPFYQQKVDNLNAQIEECKEAVGDASMNKLFKLERELKDLKLDHKAHANERYDVLLKVSEMVVALIEGDNFADSVRKSAQVLGTIQLLSPAEGNKLAGIHERYKPLYKAVLVIRLLDQLCIDETVTLANEHIQAHIGEATGEEYKQLKLENQPAYKQFVDNVKVPLIMSALLQDIGHFHPQAQAIITGPRGTEDPYRVLPVDDRKRLLQINYRETIQFLVDGIGVPNYIGNSKVERDKFNLEEHQKLIFIKMMLKTAISPKHGIGNLLKVPQIYTSIVLSTKSSFKYKLIPKVYQALYQNATHGTCCPKVVETMHKITGDFPMGFGVTYIPFEPDGTHSESYEYAIVNQLYPEQSDAPHCRVATRKLTFIGHGPDLVVKPTENLYYVDTAKGFATISKDRLNEILELLASNYQERKQLDLVPRCWVASEFFFKKEHQKLWNKA